jgi:hypothetical protein
VACGPLISSRQHRYGIAQLVGLTLSAAWSDCLGAFDSRRFAQSGRSGGRHAAAEAHEIIRRLRHGSCQSGHGGVLKTEPEEKGGSAKPRGERLKGIEDTATGLEKVARRLLECRMHSCCVFLGVTSP